MYPNPKRFSYKRTFLPAEVRMFQISVPLFEGSLWVGFKFHNAGFKFHNPSSFVSIDPFLFLFLGNEKNLSKRLPKRGPPVTYLSSKGEGSVPKYCSSV
jgi:hypothetical protein